MEFLTLSKNAIDLSGKNFVRWTVLGPTQRVSFPSGAEHVYWLCKCQCGVEKEVNGQSLRKGLSVSCGCYQLECASRRGNANRRHGLRDTPEWGAWASMRYRCFSKSHKQYPNYGGRGITVCSRWLVFESFFEDMGRKPGLGFSIDRIDNDGNYEPGNCRWATSQTQNRNNRGNRIVEAFGRTAPLASFFDAGSVDPAYERCLNRLRLGWAVERAIVAPPMRF